MSKIRFPRRLGLLALMCVAGTSSALTIGRYQGAVQLGRPLEILVPVGLDAGMAPSDVCPEAEVSYGDLRLSPRLVDVQLLGTGEALQVRIRSAQPLDEPFASVQLRVGCTQRLGRKFVLLAEEPAGDAPMSVQAPATVPVEAAKAGPVVATAAATSAVAPAAAPAPAPASQAPRARAERAPANPQASAPAALARPRLKLEPLEIRPQSASAASPAPAARGASVAAPAPASAGEAAAGEASVRVQALEAEVQKLQEALRRSQAAAAELRARAQDIEKDRFANPLVYGLVAVAGLALALAALAWRRVLRKQAPAWWQEAGTPASAMPAGPAPASASSAAPAPVRAAGAPPSASAEPLRPSTLIATGRVPGVGPAPGVASAAAALDARLPESLSLSTNELSDIQQEADFFVSLGEYDRAIEVLRNHIEIHPQASALAWLDLLEIQHKLGRQEEYEQLRRDFEWLFNARVPAFEAFDVDQNGLEDHPELLAQIQALWPDPGVLDVIDAGIFRTPADGKDKPLGLQAYRDLLFLHQLARDIGAAASAPAPSEVVVAPPGQLDPWSAADGLSLAQAAAAVPADALAGSSPAFSGPGAGGAGPLSAAAQALNKLPTPARGTRSLDIDLDVVLAQPAAAPDPAREKTEDPQLTQGLDQLLNFDLDIGHVEDKHELAPRNKGGGA